MYTGLRFRETQRISTVRNLRERAPPPGLFLEQTHLDPFPFGPLTFSLYIFSSHVRSIKFATGSNQIILKVQFGFCLNKQNLLANYVLGSYCVF